MAVASAASGGGFDQYRGIYLKRIPTYSFPLMLDVMRELGVEPGRILKNTGLTVADVEQEGTLVSFLQTLKLMHNVLATSPRPDIGLLVGDRYQISTYGLLGYVMMSCPTWGDALRMARRYYQVASSLVGLELDVDQQRQTLTFTAIPFYRDLKDIEPFTVEKLFASLIAVTRPLLQRPTMPRRVSFAYPAPAYADIYQDIFQCPVEFGAQANCFELDIELLQQPPLLANAVSAEMGRKLCEEFMGRYPRETNSLTRQITDILLSSPGQLPGMEQVAERLHVSSRTLRRKLQHEETTFQRITDGVRHDLARRYLESSRLSLDEIAHLVGFTETTNFRRAFKRWQGVPPARYREGLAVISR
jgi:AraC-like DNA-binding protein